MKLNIDKKYIHLGITSFLVVAAAICFYYAIFYGENVSEKLTSAFHIASPVIYGIIVAYLLTPIVNFLEKKLLIPFFTRKKLMNNQKKKIMRLLSVTLTMIIVILFFYGFCSILIPNIIISIRNISLQIPSYVQNISYWTTQFLDDNPKIERVVIQILNMYSGEFSNYLNNNIIPQMESLVKTVSLSLISVLKVLWNFIIGLIISIYVLCSKETFTGQAKKMLYAMFTTQTANRIISDTRFVSETFIGFISGKIVDSFIIGCLCFAGTKILDLPYAILVSVIVGVTNVIPFFGPYLGAIPCAILILMESPIHCVYFCIFIFLLQQLDGNVIGPKILGESTGLSGFWVIFSITIFGGLFGIIGMIIGVPFFAVVYAMTKRVTEKHLKKKGLPIESDKYLHVKRIEDNVFIPREEAQKKMLFKRSARNLPDVDNDKMTQTDKHETNTLNKNSKEQ